MDVSLKPITELTEAELSLWQHFVDSNAVYSSPYFRPEFTQDVAAVRDDVQVAVIEDDGHVCGFFPLQLQGSTATPVGGQLSDAHGVITEDGKSVDWNELLQACGLQTWKFHYLLGEQCPATGSAEITPAAIMNLQGGFEQYASRLKSRNVIKQADRKYRKTEREFGNVRFEWNCRDEAMLDQLIQWKSDQYRRSDIADVFQFEWTSALLRKVWQRQGSELRGLLSVLYGDDRPLAMHFGMQCGNVLHQWFPAYDPSEEFKPFSPGAVHLIEEARAACDYGIERIDLGKTCSYKERIATDFEDVAEGVIDLNPFSRLLRTSYQSTYEWLRHSRFKSVVRVPGRMIRRFVENRQFE